MSSDLAVFLVFITLFTAVIVVFAILQGRRQSAHEEELRRGASARGWKFESLKEGGYKVQRFHGDTDGVEWMAESLQFMTGGQNKHRRKRRIARWHGRWSPGLNAPIVCLGLPKGAEAPAFPALAEQGEGFLARMVQKAAGFAFDMALDELFGDEAGAQVDARTLRPVDVQLPGFIVMAANDDEAKRALSEGLERALGDAPKQPGSLLAEDSRPSVLIQPKGISLARMERIRTINELEQFIQAGTSLTRAFKFGRRA